MNVIMGEINPDLPDRKLGSKQQNSVEKPTFRFELNLKPTKRDYAEFNYMELLASETGETNCDDGSSFPTPVERPSLCNDFNYDKVIGYDTTDSFIDDSELFDEYVDTSSIGFYINYKNAKSKKSPVLAKPKTKPLLLIPKKQAKAKKRENRHLPIGVKAKKLKPEDDEIQIVNEVIRTPIGNSGIECNIPGKTLHDKMICIAIEEECPKLPSDLPQDLVKCLNLLISEVTLVKVGKVIVLNERIKQLLVEFGDYLLCFNVKTRSDVYSYLAHRLSLSANNLKKKSKILIMRKLNNDIETAIINLALAIKKSTKTDSEITNECSSIIRPSSDSGFSSLKEVNVNSSDVSSILKINNDSKYKSNIESGAMVKSKSCSSDDFLTVSVKEHLLGIFGLKKKLYAIRRVKNKSFQEELMEYVHDDVYFMWMPSERQLGPLIELAKSFYTSECSPRSQKFMRNKLKENLMTKKPSSTIVKDSTVSCSIKPLKAIARNSQQLILDQSTFHNSKSPKFIRNKLKENFTMKKPPSTIVKDSTSNIKPLKVIAKNAQKTILDQGLLKKNAKVTECNSKPQLKAEKKVGQKTVMFKTFPLLVQQPAKNNVQSQNVEQKDFLKEFSAPQKASLPLAKESQTYIAGPKPKFINIMPKENLSAQGTSTMFISEFQKYIINCDPKKDVKIKPKSMSVQKLPSAMQNSMNGNIQKEKKFSNMSHCNISPILLEDRTDMIGQGTSKDQRLVKSLVQKAHSKDRKCVKSITMTSDLLKKTSPVIVNDITKFNFMSQKVGNENPKKLINKKLSPVFAVDSFGKCIQLQQQKSDAKSKPSQQIKTIIIYSKD